MYGERFPEEKAKVVRALREEGKRVAFVGDGINDLPALAYWTSQCRLAAPPTSPGEPRTWC